MGSSHRPDPGERPRQPAWSRNCSNTSNSRLACEECGALREESPDSRINEMKRMGIHVDLTDPSVTATMDEHNTMARSI